MLKKWLLHFVLFTLCVVQVSALCPPGAMQGLTPFECYVPVRADGSWYMAEQDCEARGGKLASSTTAFLNAFYAKMLLETYDDEDYLVLLGGTSGANGKWRWSDGRNFTYTNWQTSPSNTASQCLALKAEDGQWLQRDCSLGFPHLCEVPGSQSEPQSNCESTWTYFATDNACYKVFKVAHSWTDAERICISHGSHLTSIHSVEEEDFVKDLARTGWIMPNYYAAGVWIGLKGDSPQGTYEWTYGSKVDYTNWGMNRPQPGNGVLYVVLYADEVSDPSDYMYGFWENIYDQFNVRAFVCKNPSTVS